MNLKKGVVSFLLIISLIVSFSACKNNKSSDEESEKTESVLVLKDPALVEKEMTPKVNAFGSKYPVNIKELNLSNKQLNSISNIYLKQLKRIKSYDI